MFSKVRFYGTYTISRPQYHYNYSLDYAAVFSFFQHQVTVEYKYESVNWYVFILYILLGFATPHQLR